MFGYYEKGLKQKELTEVFDITRLATFIKGHPRKEDIKRLHAIEYKSPEYCELKENLPVLTPTGLFRTNKESKNLFQLSQYMYFDIDAESIQGDVEEFKTYLIEKYSEHISLAGLSIGGRGLFFYVKCNGGLTTRNYVQVYKYLTDEVFTGIKVDMKCSNINRLQFIPYDSNLYWNPNISIEIPYDLLKVETKKETPNIKNNSRIRYQLDVSFLPISEVLSKIQWESYEYRGDKLFEINPIEYHRLYIPYLIPDGSKHRIFRGLINGLLAINPHLTLIEVQAVINYVNENRTGDKKMTRTNMLRTVTAEYDRIKETGDVKLNSRLKTIHFNKECCLKGDDKRIIANRTNGLIAKLNSVLQIERAKEQLLHDGKKITRNNIARITKLSLKTVSRYYEEASDNLLQQIEAMQNTAA